MPLLQYWLHLQRSSRKVVLHTACSKWWSLLLNIPSVGPVNVDGLLHGVDVPLAVGQVWLGTSKANHTGLSTRVAFGWRCNRGANPQQK